MTDLCTKEEAAAQDIKQRLDNLAWDLEANPKAVQGLKLILEAAEPKSDWGKFMSQIFLDSLTSENGEESKWYIEVRLCKKEQDNDNPLDGRPISKSTG